jgi:glucose/arabinose dehydrogenase
MRVAVVAALCFALAGSAAAGGEGTLALEPVASGLADPVHVTVAPGEPGRLYVVELRGRVRLLERGGLRTVLDIRRLVARRGLRGLYSVAFHPGYARNRRLFVQYAGRDGSLWIVEYRGLARRTVLRLEDAVHRPYGHYGGQLAFGPGGDLYAGIGDGVGEGDAGVRAQDLTSPFGKILRIDVDAPVAAPRVVAYGLRNPWRFSFDRATGDLYVGDVGERRWEEVDHLRRRAAQPANFGWDLYEGRERHRDGPTAGASVVFPVAVYARRPPHCSIVGGFVYRGRALSRLRGRYVYGDLCSGAVWSLRVRGDRSLVRREPLTVRPGLYSFGEDARGELYVAAMDGTVSKLVAR